MDIAREIIYCFATTQSVCAFILVDANLPMKFASCSKLLHANSCFYKIGSSNLSPWAEESDVLVLEKI